MGTQPDVTEFTWLFSLLQDNSEKLHKITIGPLPSMPIITHHIIEIYTDRAINSVVK
jgi:hypothetical protein